MQHTIVLQQASPGVSIVEWCAFVVSLVAIAFTWAESRRNNRAIARVVRSSAGWHEDHEGQRHELHVTVRSCGLPLIQPTLKISFRHHGDPAVNTLTMPTDAYAPYPDHLTRGMERTWTFRTDRLKDGDGAMLDWLDHPLTRDVQLEVLSQGNSVLRIRINSLSQRARHVLWNAIGWVNAFIIEQVSPGQEVRLLDCPLLLIPNCTSIRKDVLQFCRYARGDALKK